MSRKLIVSADDFGFSRAYSIGAIQGYREGIVTVLSLMPNMSAAAEAVKLRNKLCPEAQLVQHTNFVQGTPVSNPADVPTLVDEQGFFYRSYRWRGDNPNDSKCQGDVYPSYEDLRRETRAQAERFRELTGAYPMRIEGHSLITEPMVRAFRDVAEELGAHYMGCEGACGMRSCRECPEGFGDAYQAIINRGSLPEDWEQGAFDEILACDAEIAVIHFHPGYVDQTIVDNTSLVLPRCRDLETLCDPRVRAWVEGHGIELVDFSAVFS